MSTNYKLTVNLEATITGDICIFQGLPDTNVSNVLTLAWLSKRAHPGTKVEFNWNTEYNFNWGVNGRIGSKATFVASQVVPANFDTQDQISFDHKDGAYYFFDQTQSLTTEENLSIVQGSNVRSNQAYVGIGMSGAGGFVVPSQPNMKVIFKPKPTYYLVFGNFTQGQVVDVAQLTNPCEVMFYGTTEKTMTLNSNNNWS